MRAMRAGGWAWALGSICLTLGLLACGDDSSSSSGGAAAPSPASSSQGAASPAQPAQPSPAQPTGPATTPPGSATAAASGGACAPPEGSLRGDAGAGAAVYGQYCNLCHGPDAAPMTPPPADHSDCGYMTQLTDEHLFRVICGGGAAVGKAPTMPPWGSMVPTDDILNLIGHLRSICPT